MSAKAVHRTLMKLTEDHHKSTAEYPKIITLMQSKRPSWNSGEPEATSHTVLLNTN